MRASSLKKRRSNSHGFKEVSFGEKNKSATFVEKRDKDPDEEDRNNDNKIFQEIIN